MKTRVEEKSRTTKIVDGISVVVSVRASVNGVIKTFNPKDFGILLQTPGVEYRTSKRTGWVKLLNGLFPQPNS